MELVSVAALADNRVIGKNGELPWESLPEDKKQYRARVSDSPVILGRKTFESMRENVPGRQQIVLSRTEQAFPVETATHARTVEETIRFLETTGEETAYVLGGEKIYELFQPHLDRMVLTRVPGVYEGDTYYPEWDEREWERVSKTPYEQFTLEEWVRAGG